MLRIYGFDTFNVLKALLTAEELGLDYEYIALDPLQGEHKSAQHLARHPLGKVPVIDHGGRILFESNAICRYLAAAHESALYPADVYRRALNDQWIDLVTQHVGRWIAEYFYQEHVRPHYLDLPTESAALEVARAELAEPLALLEKQIGTHGGLVADELQLADLIAWCYFQVERLTSLDFSDHRALSDWYQGIAGRPAVARAQARIQAA